MSAPISIPIVMVGAAGRMGRAILQCAGESAEPYDLVGAVEGPGHPLLGQDVRVMIPGAPEGVVLSDRMPDRVPDGTVVIVFSLPEPTLDRLAWCEANGVAVVIGTTGLDAAQRSRVAEAARAIPVILSPNTSVGVNVLVEVVALATELLGEDYDAEIAEMHHRFKKDAPSGTARRLAETVMQVRRGDYDRQVRNGREGISGDRPPDELGMHALRGGDVVGDHTVFLVGMGERLELTHRAHSRDTFARGALRAARWLSGRSPGLYGMKDVLGL